MQHKGTNVIETGRLLLRPFRREDAEAMFCNWASDPEVTKFLTWPAHESAGVTGQVLENWIARYDRKDYYNWAIELKELGEPVGNISAVKTDDRTESATVGYCMGRNWWGQEIMPEALTAVLRYFFEEAGMKTVNACHDPRNPKSGRVMQKCGMAREGIWRGGGVNNQGICDEVWYSVLREEYEENLRRAKTVRQVTEPEEKRAIARRILEALPDWFGIPEAREDYIAESGGQVFFAASREGAEAGFLCLKETGSATLELAVMGVLREYHRQGTGKKLFAEAKKWARKQGYSFLQVKTVQMGHYKEYDATNRFYLSLGFQELEVFPALWDPFNPCQIYVMSV